MISTLKWILNKYAGTEISQRNFQKNRIPHAIITVGITLFFIFVADIFFIIESILNISKQPWYSIFFAQFSFILISVKIIFLTLFTKLNDPLGRYKVALIYQLIGLVFGVVLNVVLNDFILPSQNIEPKLKILYSLLPYTINAIMFIAMNRIYTDRNFREDKYLNSEKR